MGMQKFLKLILTILSFYLGYFVIAAFFNPQPLTASPMNSEDASTAVAGIVPHHLVADEIIQKFFATVGSQNPKTIIIISPDHWGVAKGAFTTTTDKNFRSVPVDVAFREKLVAAFPTSIYFNDKLLDREHGITNLVPYIKKFSPQTKIVPIAVSAVTDETTLDKFSDFLSTTDDVVIIASSDFSHYLPSWAADLHDATSIAALSTFDRVSFRNLEVDCWQCLYVASSVSELKGAKSLALIGHSNSARLLKSENTAPETTSYVSFIFYKGWRHNADTAATLLSVGDIMLGRHVETLMDRAGEDYPFKKISQFLRGVDVVFGNLEGTIRKNHTRTPNSSTKFSFSPKVAKMLRRNNVSVVSLANNHTLDYGRAALEETKNFLKQFRIAASGDPSKINEDSVVIKNIRGKKIAFVSFHFTGPYPKKQASYALVKNLKDKNNFVVVNVHWGEEYSLRANNNQKTIAHNLIENGADLIVGHHPHVVQEIERYKNGIIFYSLGNFIFDQYFSKYTQEGLVIGAELQDTKVIYRLFPTAITQSQPSLMVGRKAQEWLHDLSSRSDTALAEQIKSGMIVMPLWKIN